MLQFLNESYLRTDAKRRNKHARKNARASDGRIEMRKKRGPARESASPES